MQNALWLALQTYAIILVTMKPGLLEPPKAPSQRAGTAHGAGSLGTWAALRESTFLSFWLFSFMAFIGASMQNVGAGWLMVSLGGSPLQVSLIQGAMSVSVMLAGMLSGVLADLYDRRLIMLIALTGLMLATGAIGFLAFSGGLSPTILLAVTFLFGLASSGMTPAMQSTLPDLVPLAYLPSAVTLNGMSSSAARSVGPAFAGALIGLIGAGATLMLNVLAFAGLWIIVARWRDQERIAQVANGRIAEALRAGLRFAWHDPAFRSLLLQVFACFFGVSAVLGLLPSFVMTHFSDGTSGAARHLGALLSCYGVGSVFGALTVAVFTRRYNRMRIVWAATALCGACMLMLVSAGGVVLPGLAMLGAGFCWSIALTCVNISAQLMLPRELLARGLSLSMVALMVALAAGSVVWGLVATALTVGRAIGAAGAVAIIWALAQLARPQHQGKVASDGHS
jgi:MFS family permease